MKTRAIVHNEGSRVETTGKNYSMGKRRVWLQIHRNGVDQPLGIELSADEAATLAAWIHEDAGWIDTRPRQ